VLLGFSRFDRRAGLLCASLALLAGSPAPLASSLAADTASGVLQVDELVQPRAFGSQLQREKLARQAVAIDALPVEFKSGGSGERRPTFAGSCLWRSLPVAERKVDMMVDEGGWIMPDLLFTSFAWLSESDANRESVLARCELRRAAARWLSEVLECGANRIRFGGGPLLRGFVQLAQIATDNAECSLQRARARLWLSPTHDIERRRSPRRGKTAATASGWADASGAPSRRQ
jgi:hypothetical protein